MYFRKTLTRLAVLLAVMVVSAAPSASSDSFGVRGIPNRGSSLKKGCQMVRDAGIGWHRLAMRWNQVVNASGEFDFEDMDKRIQVMLNHGIEIMVTLRSVHEIFAPGSGDIDLGNKTRITSAPPASDHVGAYEDFLRQVVERYDGDGYGDARFIGENKHIKHWQIENEPGKRPESGSTFWYGSTPYEYAELFLLAYDVIKETDPEAVVALAGFNHGSMQYGLKHDRSFLSEVLMRLSERGGSFDVFDYHFYEDSTRAASVPGTVHAFLDDYPAFQGTPIWVTETNVDKTRLDPYFTEEEYDRFIAKDIVKRFTTFLENGIEKVFWFKLCDGDGEAWFTPREPDDYGNLRGLTTSSFAPKPVYYTYKLLIEKIKGKEPAQPPELGETVRACKFGFDDDAVYVLWSDNADGGTVYVDLSLPWERVLITHIVAERDATEPVEETAETLDGVLPLLLDDSPVFIQKY